MQELELSVAAVLNNARRDAREIVMALRRPDSKLCITIEQEGRDPVDVMSHVSSGDAQKAIEKIAGKLERDTATHLASAYGIERIPAPLVPEGESE